MVGKLKRRLVLDLMDRKAIIYHVGSQSEIKPDDKVEVRWDGIYITHREPFAKVPDKANTRTFYPWSGITWIRTYD